MCLSTAYKQGNDEKLLEYIREVKVEGDKITLIDILGKEITVEGSIKSMNFENSKLIIG